MKLHKIAVTNCFWAFILWTFKRIRGWVENLGIMIGALYRSGPKVTLDLPELIRISLNLLSQLNTILNFLSISVNIVIKVELNARNSIY